MSTTWMSYGSVISSSAMLILRPLGVSNAYSWMAMGSGSVGVRLGLIPGFSELGNVGPRSPHAERLGGERELSRLPGRLVGDRAHAGRVFVDHSVRPLEVQKDRRRRRMSPRAEHDPHALRAQE